ncbi:hypothetical protein BDK51DRAFT_42745 [Blyttiomyces helicus]|uniref:Uncharacterized protein n=1 Tax=Blyttiomyces helicus TaxID=388810 RepID=A0A4P9WE62_9FUNG|nr:hypothetical protein BDK51DRAFT_42745 [Blyttiomyces helicus]|eukprot:RKO90055.1 hypothetical protein BDK51DRAFT_42745 [Blyttiomyces helicus]
MHGYWQLRIWQGRVTELVGVKFGESEAIQLERFIAYSWRSCESELNSSGLLADFGNYLDLGLRAFSAPSTLFRASGRNLTTNDIILVTRGELTQQHDQQAAPAPNILMEWNFFCNIDRQPEAHRTECLPSAHEELMDYKDAIDYASFPSLEPEVDPNICDYIRRTLVNIPDALYFPRSRSSLLRFHALRQNRLPAATDNIQNMEYILVTQSDALSRKKVVECFPLLANRLNRVSLKEPEAHSSSVPDLPLTAAARKNFLRFDTLNLATPE